MRHADIVDTINGLVQYRDLPLNGGELVDLTINTKTGEWTAECFAEAEPGTFRRQPLTSDDLAMVRAELSDSLFTQYMPATEAA